MHHKKTIAISDLKITIPAEGFQTLSTDTQILFSRTPIHASPAPHNVVLIAYHTPKSSRDSADRLVSAGHIITSKAMEDVAYLTQQCDEILSRKDTHDIEIQTIAEWTGNGATNLDSVMEHIADKLPPHTIVTVTQINTPIAGVTLLPEGTFTITSHYPIKMVSPRFKARVLKYTYSKRKEELAHPPTINRNHSVDFSLLTEKQRPMLRRFRSSHNL